MVPADQKLTQRPWCRNQVAWLVPLRKPVRNRGDPLLSNQLASDRFLKDQLLALVEPHIRSTVASDLRCPLSTAFSEDKCGWVRVGGSQRQIRDLTFHTKGVDRPRFLLVAAK